MRRIIPKTLTTTLEFFYLHYSVQFHLKQAATKFRPIEADTVMIAF